MVVQQIQNHSTLFRDKVDIRDIVEDENGPCGICDPVILCLDRDDIGRTRLQPIKSIFARRRSPHRYRICQIAARSCYRSASAAIVTTRPLTLTSAAVVISAMPLTGIVTLPELVLVAINVADFGPVVNG